MPFGWDNLKIDATVDRVLEQLDKWRVWFAVVFLAGVAFVLVGAIGDHSPNLALLSAGFLIIFISIVAFVAGQVTVFVSSREKEREVQYSREVEERPDVRAEITSPKSGDVCPRTVEIYGTCTGTVPASYRLWLFTTKPPGTEVGYWPQMPLSTNGNTWHCVFKTWPNADSDIIQIFLVGENGQALIENHGSINRHFTSLYSAIRDLGFFGNLLPPLYLGPLVRLTDDTIPVSEQVLFSLN